MPKDIYSSFCDLLENETNGTDYRIVSKTSDSANLIMAPHGGNIEPQTSQIAACIAKEKYSLYLFEGLRTPLSHHELHVTSHRCDEPQALKIVGSSDRIVAVHGRKDGDDPETVWLGGLDTDIAKVISDELGRAGFATCFPEGLLAGKHPNNICNRNRRSMGVQLELPRTLRATLGLSDALNEVFCEAIRNSLPR